MCGLFLKGPEFRSIFEEARSLELSTPDLAPVAARHQMAVQPTHPLPPMPKVFQVVIQFVA